MTSFEFFHKTSPDIVLTMAEVDKACCSLPVAKHDYTPKGTYTKLAGLDVCRSIEDFLPSFQHSLTLSPSDTTGPLHATRALIAVYDVFGYQPQTLQGADLLAHALNAIVLMPDFFRGNPLPKNVYPPDTDEKKRIAGEFVRGTADIDTNVGKMGSFVKEAKGKYEGVKGWGCYGLCWGGKVAVLSSGTGTELKAAGTAHPG